MDTIKGTNSLDPDQARQNVGPDLDPNCLQRLSAADDSGSQRDHEKIIPDGTCRI